MAVLSPRLGAGWESKLKLRKREWEMTQSLAVAPVCWDAVLGQVRPSLLLHRSGRALRGAPASSPPGLGARTLSGSQLFLLQHRGTGAPQLSSFPRLTEISLEKEEGLLTLVPENFLCNTGCMAKAPGERGAARKTGRKEESESFMAVTSFYEKLHAGGGSSGGGGGGGSSTPAWSLQSEPAMRSENQRLANKHFEKVWHRNR